MANSDLKDKIVIVTGSSRGIGKEIALSFASYGAKVCVTYLSQKKSAEYVCKKIKTQNVDCMNLRLDVTKRKSVKNVLNKIIQKWGRLDILVNNAGYLEQKPFFNITNSEWDKILEINLKSIFICSQEIGKYFRSRKAGCIINISSVGGQIGGPNAPHYAAAKAGIISLTKSTARLLSPYGIRVNAVSPGFIKTDMYKNIVKRSSQKEINKEILLRRPGNPEEVASTVVFLASKESSYITGQVLNVNGGLFLP